MPKRMNHYHRLRSASARRGAALARVEIREATEPRQAAASPTSFPVKKTDTAVRALIDAALKARAT